MHKYYVTFGQIHTHSIDRKTIDKDCVVLFEASNYEEARVRAFSLFKGKFCNISSEIPDMWYYPRGLIKI